VSVLLLDENVRVSKTFQKAGLGLEGRTPRRGAFLCFFCRTQGSIATHLRCGGIFSDSVITNFLLIMTVK